MTTKRQCEAAARRQYGSAAFVRENRNALTPEQRSERVEKIAALRKRERELDEQIKAMQYDWLTLLQAVEFWRDVDGGEPSTSHLKEAAANCRQYVDLCDELRSTKTERESIRTYSYRWQAGHIFEIPGLGQGSSIDAHADSLDELLAKIEPSREPIEA